MGLDHGKTPPNYFTLMIRPINQSQLAAVQAVVREVARNARPPLLPSEVVKGRGPLDNYHIARLRGIIGLRLKADGFPTIIISEIFGQPWVTTHNQIKTAPALRNHPRFYQFFPQS